MNWCKEAKRYFLTTCQRKWQHKKVSPIISSFNPFPYLCLWQKTTETRFTALKSTCQHHSNNLLKFSLLQAHFWVFHISWQCSSKALYFIYLECFHSRGQHICKFIVTKESVCIRKVFNSHGTGLGHQHGRRFIVLGHQYGRRDVMWKHSIDYDQYVHGGWSRPRKQSPAVVRDK